MAAENPERQQPIPRDSDAWDPDEIPFVEGYEDPAADRAPLVGMGVPAVVAVVVTDGASGTLEESLEALDAQEYGNMAVLVFNTGAGDDVAERVGSVLPTAFVKRVAGRSFGEAANDAIQSVEGAAFYLFLHDDTALAPGAVQAMVEEGFRSNAGIVGAKLVDWSHPDRIVDVGSAVDKFGFLVPYADQLEKDQGQHDAVREAFVVPTACMLVRSDLFADLGGFSEDLEGSSEALDFCWRARVAGARTVLMSAAKARHSASSPIGDAQLHDPVMAFRGQARVVLSVYTPLQLLRILPQAVLFAAADVVVSVLTGRFRVAQSLLVAMFWNLVHLPTTLRVRSQVKASRRATDEQIRVLQVSGSVRVKEFLRHQADQVAGLSRRQTTQAGAWSRSLIATLFVALVMLGFGTRGLWSDGIPVIREFAPFSAPSNLLTQWWTGWHDAGLGSASTAPTLSGVAGLLGVVSLDHTGAVRTFMIWLPLAVGAFGAWRLGSLWSRRMAALTAVVYLANPVPYNALSQGYWQALAVYATVPFIVRVLQATVEPEAPQAPRRAVSRAVSIGAALAFGAVVSPFVLVVAVLLSGVTMLYSAGTGTPRTREIGSILGAGVLIASMVHLPWFLAILGSPNRWSLMMGSAPISPDGIPSASDSIILANGPHGSALTGVLLIAGVVPVLFARGWRQRVAQYALGLQVTGAVMIAITTYLGSTISLPTVAAVQPVLVCGVSLGIAVGVQSFLEDVIGGVFSWRQVVGVVLGAGCLVAASAQMLGSFDGTWRVPRGDIDSTMAPLASQNGVENSRILWLGRSDVMPVTGWTVEEDIHVAVTLGPRPNLSSLFQGEPHDGERALFGLVSDVVHNREFLAGSRLAAYGIRYVVVVEQAAPPPYATKIFPTSPLLLRGLAQQEDLKSVDVIPGFLVYENDSWTAVRSVDAIDEQGQARRVSVLNEGDPPDEYSGVLPSGDTTVFVAANYDDGWSMKASDQSIAPSRDGWAMRFDVNAEEARLEYSPSSWQYFAHFLQLMAILALPLILSAGSRLRRRGSRAIPEAPLITMEDR